jgi:nucleoside-diphosphate-sugar epimerase
MRIFITGASGWIGSAVTDELLTHGHDVVGLARSDASASALAAKGATVHRGDLDDPASLAKGAADADAVIHLGFKHDFENFGASGLTERAAVQAMLDVLEGTGRPFLISSGLPSGDIGILTESDALPHHGPDSARGGSENLALDYVDRGVHAVALRFSPTTHGVGDHGFAARLTQIARERGVAAYIGDGSTHWSAVHRDDAARLVRLALDKAPAGARVHAVAETNPTRDIAAAIGDSLGLPTASVAPDTAAEHFGWIGWLFGMNVAGTNAATRELLGWTPTGPTLFEDIAGGAYTS